MEDRWDEKEGKHFRERLEHLWKSGYINNETYFRALEADRSYIVDQESLRERETEVSEEPVPPDAPFSKEVSKSAPVKKKVKTKEQIRERNITWSLILGVTLLLLTGLIIATSQWEQMGAGAKVAAIAFVSLFFFGLSYVTGRFLRIHQTAFAFLTLGSLLIPIGIVAIGYFELLGNYLSLWGEGRHILGLIGSLLSLPIYLRHALVHQSRFYVWVSFIFMTLTAGFLLGSLPLGTDAFYLGMMVYNAGLITFYVRSHKTGPLKLFTKELPLFTQGNLVLSTLLMLFFFDNEVFYSFNLLLTACIYMAMVFVYQTKEYQFVFSVMVVYAAYQLVEHSPLQQVDLIIYAVTGFIYLGLSYVFKDHSRINQLFRYISGIVSFLAFVYISYESLFLRGEEGSWLLFLAYVGITVNYLLLAHVTRYPGFQYLTPVFFFISLWQLWELIGAGRLSVWMFVLASFVSLVPGMWAGKSILRSVKESTFYTALVVMAGCISYSFYAGAYGETSFMFFVLGGLAYTASQFSREESVKKAAVWGHPGAFAVSGALFYEPLVAWIPAYEEGLAFPFHLAVTGILLLAVHLMLKKWGKRNLASTTFYIAQGSYLTAILLLINHPGVDPMIVRPLILLTGIGVSYWLVRVAGNTSLWGVVSLVTLAFYFSMVDPLGIERFDWFLVYLLFAPVLLVMAGEWGKNRWIGMRPYFYWLAHIIQPFLLLLLLLNQMGMEKVHPLLLLVPVALYSYSAWKAQREAEIKAMLYAACTVFFFLVFTVPDYYDMWPAGSEPYAFLFTSLILSGLWFLFSSLWKRRLDWYWIPFSILGLYMMILMENISNVELVPIVSYACLILFFLHKRKWSAARFIPLLMILTLIGAVSQTWEQSVTILSLLVSSAVLMAAGRVFHPYLIGSSFDIDTYSWSALVYMMYMSFFTSGDGNVWIRILPVLLVGVWLLVTAPGWRQDMPSRIFISTGIFCFYVSYLFILLDYEPVIPDLLEAELQALPGLGLLFYLKKRTWSSYASIMSHVQSAVLLFIAAYLVVDAIQSHTLLDAWIIGGLSLASMVAGMQLKIKSYFFVGMGVLVFNVLYQTKPYWGSAPWWVYLLTAGVLLIGIASYNEWKKQQSEDSQPFERKLKRLWLSFKEWD
ncbi:hypothetical protein [Halobacillus litoralis]|uniref:hypothetical protein n=1 Tax=Halobacillus litoralis TaxID=45668 RepID=UPI001CFC8BDF|nr:hypothetical protein [Halobacillus litoralis]